MSYQLLLGLCIFVLVASFTPGPNNIMLMSSGVHFGFARTWPHMLGVTLGFTLMVVIIGLGLGVFFDLVPGLYSVLKFVSVAYLLYLAWLIANSGPITENEGQRRPMTFLQAAAFQWVNPKGWIMVIGGVSSFAAIASFPFNVILIALIFGSFCIFSSLAWTGLGSGLRRFINTPRSARIFNVCMALALVASVVPVLFEGH